MIFPKNNKDRVKKFHLLYDSINNWNDFNKQVDACMRIKNQIKYFVVHQPK